MIFTAIKTVAKTILKLYTMKKIINKGKVDTIDAVILIL